MDINIERYVTEVERDENSCSLRYKLSGETVGVMRYTYFLNVGKKVRQEVVLLREMDIDRMLGGIMFDMSFSPELGESVVKEIKENSYRVVNNFLKENPSVFVKQAASD